MDMTKPAAGFSDVGYKEAMRRAHELVPFLREQAPKCEEARKLTPAVMDALNRTGMLRYLQPKVRGGMELPFIAYFDIPEMLARPFEGKRADRQPVVEFPHEIGFARHRQVAQLDFA